MVVQPQPISVSADDTTSQDTSVVAKGEESKAVKAAATQVVKSSDKEVPAAAKAAVKKATAAISEGNPNTKLRDFVILSAKYIGKFSSKQWAMVTKELEAALEESREEYKSSKK
jgi:DNA polymerase IIIc chi subunit